MVLKNPGTVYITTITFGFVRPSLLSRFNPQLSVI